MTADEPITGLLPFRLAVTLYASAVIPLATITCCLVYAATDRSVAALAVTDVALGIVAARWHERPVAWIQRYLARKPTPGE
jgi:hypothetical protein